MWFQILTEWLYNEYLFYVWLEKSVCFIFSKKANQGVCTNYFKVSDVGSWIQSPQSVTSRLSSSKTLCIWAIFTHQKLSQMHGFLWRTSHTSRLNSSLLREVITARSLDLRWRMFRLGIFRKLNMIWWKQTVNSLRGVWRIVLNGIWRHWFNS